MNPHGLHQLGLPPEPIHFQGVPLRPHNGITIADPYALILPAIDGHIVAACEQYFDVRLLSGDQPGCIGDPLVTYETRTIDRRIACLWRSSLRRASPGNDKRKKA